jgi:hypothetical protein
MKTKTDLIEEVIANARRDRSRLEKVADALLTVSSDTPEAPAEGEEAIAQAAASAAVSEELSKVTDSLTKINQQLVEIVKHQRRTADVDEAKTLDKNEKEDIYAQMENERKGKSKSVIQ